MDDEQQHPNWVKKQTLKWKIKKSKKRLNGLWLNDWLIVEFLRRVLIPLFDRVPQTAGEIQDKMASIMHVDDREVIFLQAKKAFLLPGLYEGPRYRSQGPELAGPRDVSKNEIMMIQVDKTDRHKRHDRRVAEVRIERCVLKEDSYSYNLSIEEFDKISKFLTFRPLYNIKKNGPATIDCLRSYFFKFLTNQLGNGIDIKITERKDWHALLQKLDRLDLEERKAAVLARRRDRMLSKQLRKAKGL